MGSKRPPVCEHDPNGIKEESQSAATYSDGISYVTGVGISRVIVLPGTVKKAAILIFRTCLEF
jgi:hypothetical protein